MKIYLPAILLCLSCVCSLQSRSQQRIYDGIPKDSTEFKFGSADTLAFTSESLDTSGCTLWKIGNTEKYFFADSQYYAGAIMTDTANSYAVNANDAFVIKFKRNFDVNMIVSFRHKLQTTAGKDGGVVEYSIDSGSTWHNIKGECNADSFGFKQGLRTTGMYTVNDTLYNGEMGFSGTQEWALSRFQFFWGLPVRTTETTSEECIWASEYYIRFRFVSDAEPDTLDGWMIDDIKIERDKYSGDVANVGNGIEAQPYPNPSSNGVIHFPKMEAMNGYSIQITDVSGRLLINVPYREMVEMGNKKGLHYYRISNGHTSYHGKILLQ